MAFTGNTDALTCSRIGRWSSTFHRRGFVVISFIRCLLFFSCCVFVEVFAFLLFSFIVFFWCNRKCVPLSRFLAEIGRVRISLPEKFAFSQGELLFLLVMLLLLSLFLLLFVRLTLLQCLLGVLLRSHLCCSVCLVFTSLQCLLWFLRCCCCCCFPCCSCCCCCGKKIEAAFKVNYKVVFHLFLLMCCINSCCFHSCSRRVAFNSTRKPLRLNLALCFSSLMSSASLFLLVCWKVWKEK